MPADVNSVNEEILNEAKKIWKEKQGIEKWKYFFYYYKVHLAVVIFAIVAIISSIHYFATQKTSICQVLVINGMDRDLYDYEAIIDGYAQTLEYDEKEEELLIDANYQIDINATDQYTQVNVQKVFMFVAAESLDVMLCDESFMQLTRAQDCAFDLTTVLPEDMLEKYEDKLVWYDFPIEEVGEDYYEEEYAGRVEALSIDVSDFAKVKNTNMFQGKKAYALIIANTKNLDNAIGFLRYLDTP